MIPYHLQVITPEEIIYDGQVVSLIAPGSAGYLGVLAHHTPLLTTLKDGICVITDTHRKRHFYKVSGGFLEVSHNQASLLVDTIAPTEPVDMTSGI